MTSAEITDGPITLVGDPERSASDSIRGYTFQIWHSVNAWLELSDDEDLYLEGAEDIDVMGPECATAIQVKDVQKNITLRSQSVLDAIESFWSINSNADTAVKFRFLTTAKLGVEKGEPFGVGRPGLDVWMEAQNKPSSASAIRDFLIGDGRLTNNGLSEFLRESTLSQIQVALIQPFSWETGRPKATAVEESISRKLVNHGGRQGVAPTVSARVLNRLLAEAWKVAGSKQRTPLTRAGFLQIFEDETTIPVPYGELFSSLGLLNVENETGPSDGSISATGLSGFPPPILGAHARRIDLIEGYVSALNDKRLLALYGSSGTGKSTAAKLIVGDARETWAWIDLGVLGEKNVDVTIQLVAAGIERAECLDGVVIDGLDFPPEELKRIEPQLCGLIYTVLSRGSRVVVTSYKPLPSRWLGSLDLPNTCNTEVPRFSLEEICELGREIGCPDDELLSSWAVVVVMQTGGHPQLVHARLISLSQSGWPQPSAEDLATQPKELTEERQATRQSLLGLLSADQRELIYRLSILIGYFRRDQAVAIGELDEPVNHPGDVFDPLVGPWIEVASSGYFRLSPLLTSAAGEVWTAEQVISVRRRIASDLLNHPPFSLIEASEIIFQGLMSNATSPVLDVASSLIGQSEDAMRRVAAEMPWLLFLGLGDGTRDLPGDPILKTTVRNLQFRVAVEVRPDLVPGITAAWLDESLEGIPKSLALPQRLLALSQICFYNENLEGKLLVQLIQELAHIERVMAETSDEILSHFSRGPERGDFDLVEDVFRIALYRNASPEFLRDLLVSMPGAEPQLRSRLLDVFRTSPEDTQLLIDRTWICEAKKDDTEQDWNTCLQSLEIAVGFGQEWDLRELSMPAVAAISVIYDEYLDCEEKAISVLDDAEERMGPEKILREQRATVALNRHRYTDAVAVLDSLYPGDVETADGVDMRSSLSCRKGGVAAGWAGDWSRSARFFSTAHGLIRESGDTTFLAGLLADCAHSCFKAGDTGRTLKCLAGALRLVDSFPDAAEDIKSIAVSKRVGHVLVWISTTLSNEMPDGFVAPPPGMCSDPAMPENFRELPRTPILGMWVLLAEIEHFLDGDGEIFSESKRRHELSPVTVFETSLAMLDIRRSLKAHDASRAVEQCARLTSAMSPPDDPAALGIGGPSISPAEGDSEETGTCPMVFLGFLLALAGAGESIRQHEALNLWSNAVGRRHEYSGISQWLIAARETLCLDSGAATAVLVDPEQTSDNRVLAAILIASTGRSSPVVSFCAHLALFDWITYQLFKVEHATHLCALAEKDWRRHCENPAALNTPRLTVPSIITACDSERSAIHKTASILLAARNAVPVNLPDGMLKKLRDAQRGDV